jgi:hypothetical protein
MCLVIDMVFYWFYFIFLFLSHAVSLFRRRHLAFWISICITSTSPFHEIVLYAAAFFSIVLWLLLEDCFLFLLFFPKNLVLLMIKDISLYSHRVYKEIIGVPNPPSFLGKRTVSNWSRCESRSRGVSARCQLWFTTGFAAENFQLKIVNQIFGGCHRSSSLSF